MDDSLKMGKVNKSLPKQQVHDLLLRRDFIGLVELCEEDRRSWRTLWATLYDEDENLRWPAIEAVAKVMERWWQAGQKENVREYIRRLLWSMCDEAGEMGWSAPQTIAEIISAIPELLEPYGSNMIARAFDEPTLVAGGLWGIGHLGTKMKEAVESAQDVILGVFNTGDTEILGLAAWAMGETGLKAALPYLVELTGRKESVQIYINGDFCQKTVDQWAQQAVVKIKAHPVNMENAE